MLLNEYGRGLLKVKMPSIKLIFFIKLKLICIIKNGLMQSLFNNTHTVKNYS